MIIAQYYCAKLLWYLLIWRCEATCHPNNFLRCEVRHIERINRDFYHIEAEFRDGKVGKYSESQYTWENQQHIPYGKDDNGYFCRDSFYIREYRDLLINKNASITSFYGLEYDEEHKMSEKSSHEDDISIESRALYTALKENEWYIETSARQYRLTTLPLNVKVILEVKNVDSKPSSKFILLFPYHEAIHMGDLEVYNKDTGNKYATQFLNCINRPSTECQWNTLLYNSWKWRFNEKCICAPLAVSITFDRQIEPQEFIKIVVNYKLGRPFSTLKDNIAFDDDQRVIFSTNTHLLSGYKIGEQRTYYSISHTSDVEVVSLHLKANVSEIKEKIYMSGPYYHVFPLSLGESLTLRFPYPSSLEYISQAVRHVSIGIWNYRVNEEFLVLNEASEAREYNAKLAKIFERDSAKGTVDTHHSFSFEAVFPQRAKNFYFYDTIGNISSAYLDRNVGDKYKVAYLVPRYPLVGGWKSAFNTEYSHPILGNPLEILLPHSILLYTESYKVIIEFPIGSCDIIVTPPSGIKCRVETVKRHILGLEFEKSIATLHIERMFPKNVEHFPYIRVDYRRTFWWIPKLICTATIHLFLLYIICRIFLGFRRKLESL
ncbi:conserved hypothetical protein [Theileria equi strain WA]|uniref:Dolichyl-diphosphooligosaccharide--protein glycosyltransferase subunit 1 n=1 Tax=Theileria equi strain WA TaxID=1537102 RepID=L1L9X0_THEEQ|nr:conserved hypothetical protein [Theileria equi strain WA]EKX71975.1 conserved hypothetical protein [Theileria equi strain WA]|eukprot:XP_004831427.1 conserved hypothetical protein [Theileria equi strain WA]